jgi:Domain of unknown function (DUF4296)
MMRLLMLAGCVLLLSVSCTDKTRVPSDVYPREKMEAMMWDMLMADRFSAQFLLKDSAKKDVKAETFKLYEQVFQIHKTNSDEFLKSYKYYLTRPDLTKVMFDSLTARAGRNRDQLYKNMK